MREARSISGLPDEIGIFTLDERPDLEARARSLDAAFPEFMHHDAVVTRYWERLYTDFAPFQIVVCERGEVVAAGNSVPVYWDGTTTGLPEGLDAALERSMGDAGEYRDPTVVSAILAVVPRENQGRGLSRVVLQAMKAVADESGLGTLIAPVRPTLKHLYPLTHMERYARWGRPDRLPFDPWLRVHRRLGAEILCVAPRSMMITGTISEWENWTGMRFPESGPYVVPGALSPVSMDIEADSGIYEEPNVWMRHAVGEALKSSDAD